MIANPITIPNTAPITSPVPNPDPVSASARRASGYTVSRWHTTASTRAASAESGGASAKVHIHRWYDVTVTADCDETWSQRFVGHLETGRPSITG